MIDRAVRWVPLMIALAGAVSTPADRAMAATIRNWEGDSLLANVRERLSPGDTLLIPAGRHRLTETLIGGITVRGEVTGKSVVLIPYIPSAPMLSFTSGSGMTRVENITFDAEENQEAQALHFVGDTLEVTGNRFFRGIAVLAENCDGLVAKNHFEDVESAVRAADSRLWIDQNEIIGAKNGAISMRGSPLRITRNRIVQNVNTGIVIVGKRFAPVIGGEPGMGNEIHGGFNSDVSTSGGKDVNAQYNYWGIRSTEEMNRYGYPANIDAIFDEWDMPKDVGEVDYRNWLDAPPPEGKPVGASGSGRPSVPPSNALVVGGGVVVIALVVMIRLRRSRGGAQAG